MDDAGADDAEEGPAGADGAADVEPVLTVRQLNERVAEHLDGALDGVRCRGEVSDLSVYDSAVYFDLVGEEAEVNCFLWRSRYDDLDAELAEGEEVLLEGRVTYYVEGGRVNVRPWEARVVGEGEAAEALRELRAELADRGWFDDAHKVQPPRFPDRVGLVTSARGDARHDVRRAIHDRDPGIDLVLADAGVQGEDVPVELADAVHRLDRQADVDVVVVGRGGGSDTDLRAFDSEALAEAIFTAETPVVAAVGHREDETVAGDVADARAITPTDAGEVVAPDRERHLADLADRARRLERTYEAFVDERFGNLEERLETAHQRHAGAELADLQRRLEAAGEAHERERERRAAIDRREARLRRYRIALAVLALAALVALALAVAALANLI